MIKLVALATAWSANVAAPFPIAPKVGERPISVARAHMVAEEEERLAGGESVICSSITERAGFLDEIVGDTHCECADRQRWIGFAGSRERRTAGDEEILYAMHATIWVYPISISTVFTSIYHALIDRQLRRPACGYLKLDKETQQDMVSTATIGNTRMSPEPSSQKGANSSLRITRPFDLNEVQCASA